MEFGSRVVASVVVGVIIGGPAVAGDLRMPKLLLINSPTDAVDKLPGDGECNTQDPVPDTPPTCALRAAVMEANATPTEVPVQIGFAKGIVNDLSALDAGMEPAASGDLDITRSMRIGNGAGASERIAVKGFAGDRVFDVQASANIVIFEGLEISGAWFVGEGHAIRSSGAHVEIRNCNIHDNRGSGLSAAGTVQVEAGTTMVVGSRIHGNGTPGNLDGMLVTGPGSMLDVRGSTVDGNNGSAITVDADALLLMANSTLSSNAFSGLQLYEANASVVLSTIVANVGEQLTLLDATGLENQLSVYASVIGDPAFPNAPGDCAFSGTNMSSPAMGFQRVR